ncbi:type IV secretion system protein [Undibacterium arcticum]
MVFGGSRWTTDFATKYLQYAVGTGIKLMLLYLVVGVGQTITQQLYIDPNQLIDSCLKCMGVALVFGYLAIQIPAMASAMMSGSPSMTAGALAGAALTMGAAAAGAGGAAVAGGKAAQGGAGGAMAGAAGLSKALGAGMSSAMDVGKKLAWQAQCMRLARSQMRPLAWRRAESVMLLPVAQRVSVRRSLVRRAAKSPRT